MKKNVQFRRSVLVSAAVLSVLFFLPLAVIVPFQAESQPKKEAGNHQSAVIELPTATEEKYAEPELRVLHNGTVESMYLEEYLLGVLRAEMPASFEVEALKAQAVAARTYTVYQLGNGGRHGDTADVCTEAVCCQAYLDYENAAERWGERATDFESKLKKAVQDTSGQVIFYDEEPILAAFHACSSGLTRSAGEVWSAELPYLQPVDSLEDEALVPDYYSRVEISCNQLRETVSTAYPQADFSGEFGTWIGDAVTDEAGNVRTVEVGGISLRGSEVRNLLGLRSACFTWEIQGESVAFFVTGYGHGVGLSQHGANQMAAEGADYCEILTHYYTGVTIAPWKGIP